MRLKEKITENAEKLASAAAGMTTRRLASEITKRFESLEKLSKSGRGDNDPEYRNIADQIQILTQEIRNRAGTMSPVEGMQKR